MVVDIVSRVYTSSNLLPKIAAFSLLTSCNSTLLLALYGKQLRSKSRYDRCLCLPEVDFGFVTVPSGISSPQESVSEDFMISDFCQIFWVLSFPEIKK